MSAIDANSIPSDVPEKQKSPGRLKSWFQNVVSLIKRDASAATESVLESPAAVAEEAKTEVSEKVNIPPTFFLKNIASFTGQETVSEIIDIVKRNYAQSIAPERQAMELDHSLSEKDKNVKRLMFNRREDRMENANKAQLTRPIAESLNSIITSKELSTEDLHKLIKLRNRVNEDRMSGDLPRSY